MRMSKENVTNYLEERGHVVDGIKWNDLLTLYKQVKEEEKTTITIDEMIDVVDKFDNDVDDPIELIRYDADDHKNNIIIKIIELMGDLKGKTRGTPGQITLMFNLYNNFYKRNESPGCSMCVANVYNKLMNIYKKYKR